MGTCLWSIHFKSDDPDAVRAAVKAVVGRKAREVRITGPENGWITAATDTTALQDTARRLAGRVKAGHAIAFHLHDSDVLFYWYFRDGKLADEYNSCPDYFCKPSRKELAATGNAGALAGLLTRRDQAKWKKLLSRTADYVFEDARLVSMLELLGITPDPELLPLGETIAESEPVRFKKNASPTIVESGGISFRLGVVVGSAEPKRRGKGSQGRKPGRSHRG